MNKIFFYLSILLFLSSCSPTIIGLYGVHAPRSLNEKKIIRHAKRLNIPPTDVFELDSSYYSYIFSLDSLSTNSDTILEINIKNRIKNHIQPLQSLYFNQTGELVSFQINCYAGGFPNLNWDRDSILTTFPPKVQAPLDSLISIPILLSFMKKMPNSEDVTEASYTSTVFVFWSVFMGRQNRRFIRYIQENATLSDGKNIRIVYLNMDNAIVKNDIW